ncbi:hypothetical protein BH10PSE16_BH10PSE16_33550 [soil metagenome]
MTQQKPTTAPTHTPVQPAAGKGRPATDPQPQKPLAGRQPDLEDASVEATLELPHDRDQASDMTGGQSNPVVTQAGQDIKKGLKDTSKAPEMDHAYKKI